MRWWTAAIIACGCNQVFGLRETVLPPPDAPPSCPAPGAPLQFASGSVGVVSESCVGYTHSTSANLAVAACVQAGGYIIKEGALDASALVEAGLTPSIAGATFDQVALSRDGAQLYVRQVASAASTFLRYRRTGDRWGSPEAAFAMAQLMTNDSIGVPSDDNGDGRRLVVGSTISLLELVEDASGMWRFRRESLFADLGVSYVAQPNLSPDALRVVFYGTRTQSGGAMYSERATRDATFGPARAISGIPSSAQTPFMTDDCGRLYYSTTNAVVYAPQ